ncbi:ABC transporter ATP-binding protein [Treponema brennaborense]|uniref:ABC transporter related protein n=1 Tax=Treponema brennaborense (strain DSM 12168 / CIP 105900 / DD5/3) TaxID=906968 RepID=F4LLZ3_TREBD|nr:ABC transporter ATP-binding protein [Treponema brennaborense]AEE15685.1 ABC transporter related protein [Treponema brennaborense DSM 12168]
MNVLEVTGLCKSYPGFALSDVSFSLEKGKITGFIGRNGAGKSTTLNSLLHFVHPDAGTITFFGKNVSEHELDIKQKVGFVSSGMTYYPKKKIKHITAVTRSFYRGWDETAYAEYMRAFNLDENKTPSQLSAGMKIKYALTLALSHNAELFVLDEPTSGLDPVSRDELLDIFMDLCDEGKSVLFSTHITSDLDKCADNIIYIKNGRILAESELRAFVGMYKTVSFAEPDIRLTAAQKEHLIGISRSKTGYTALIRTGAPEIPGITAAAADLESVMIHLEKQPAP